MLQYEAPLSNMLCTFKVKGLVEKPAVDGVPSRLAEEGIIDNHGLIGGIIRM